MARHDSFNRPDVAVKRTRRIKGGSCLLAHIFSCSFWRAAFSGNVKANSNLASCPFFTHKPGIFCAHISKVDHEMAACWDNEMHLCPIILSITCIFPGSCCWKNRQAESSSHTSGNRAMLPGCYLHAWESNSSPFLFKLYRDKKEMECVWHEAIQSPKCVYLAKRFSPNNMQLSWTDESMIL